MAVKFNPLTGKFDLVNSPGGSNTYVQFNDGGVFGGVSQFTFNKTTNVLTLTGSQVIQPGTDVTPLTLKAGGTSTSVYTAEYRDSGNVLWGYVRKRILSDANQGAEFTFNSSGTGATSRTGFLVTLNAGYTGAEFTNALTFDSAVAGTATYYTADQTVYGYRASGNRGGGGFARGVTTGHNVGWMVLAGGGAVNYALWASSTIAKASAINVGVFANAYNASVTSPAYIGLYATIYNTATAPPNMAGVKTAILADNQSFAADIILGRDNGTTVFNICDYGLLVSTQVANTTGAANFWTVTSAANTGRTASTEVVNLLFNLSADQTWAAGSITTQREVLFRYPSYSFASASTITTAATVAIEGAPLAGSNATITNPLSLWVQAGSTRLGAGTTSYAPLNIPTGTNKTTAASGDIENDGTSLYYTGTAAVRQTLVQAAYGNLYEDNETGTSITVTTAGTFYGWVSATSNGVKLMTADTSNATADRLTVNTGGAGEYLVSFDVSYATTNNNIKTHWQVFKNGTAVANINSERKFINGSYSSSLSASGIITLAANDYIDLRTTADNNGEVITVYHCSFVAVRVSQ